MREYSLTFLVATLMLAFFCKLLEWPNLRNSIILGILFVIGIFLQYGLVLLILTMNIAVVLELFFAQRAQKRMLLINWVVTQIPVLIATFIVYNLSLYPQITSFGHERIFSGYLSGDYWNGSLPSLAEIFIINTANFMSFTYGGYLFLFLVLVGIVASLSIREYRRPLVLFIITFIVALVAADGRLYPNNGIRQDIYLTPMTYSLAGIGVSYWLSVSKRQLVVALFAVLICAQGLMYTLPYLNNPGNENIRPVIKSLTSSFELGDRIYVHYLANPAFTYYFRDNQDAIENGVNGSGNPQENFEQIDNMFSKKGAVWMVFTNCYGDVCTPILDYVAGRYGIELITQADDAYLYVSNGTSVK